jgi:2-polyprenyl-3-methyl-5-hydroxy-6-metoxy-1,4-benzoquinol methylase
MTTHQKQGCVTIMNHYQHPVTFKPTENVSLDFRHTVENYETNLSDLLPKDPAARILDVGCGWGQFLWWLRSKGYTAAQGIDASAQQVSYCQSLGLQVTQVADAVHFMNLHEARFELVTLHHVIEHLDFNTGMALLVAIRRSLRPRARVIVQTPNMSSFAGLFSRYIEVTHVTGFTENSLAEALELAAFKDIRVFGGQNPVHLRPRRLVWLGLQATTRFVWRMMLFAELGIDRPRILHKNLYATGVV